ncbi:hypothetical protein LJR090_000359 [Bosea sp. LjRoot90]|uniref:hypothetical protein n=1 Tax=Bosea sp. LjRoot90 TaxID=3342342 RepID=UPI003ED10BE6
MARAFRAFVLALACLAGFIAPAAALDRARLNEARPVSEVELGAMLQAASRGRAGVSGVRLDAGDFVVIAGGTEMRFGLASLSAQLNKEPDASHRQKAFDSLLQKLDRMAASGDPSKPSPAEIARFRDALLPVLKNRSYVDEFAALARKQGVSDGKLLHLPLAGDVIVVPALDLPRITRFVPVGEGRRYGMSDAEVFEAALANLERRAKRFEIHDHGVIRAFDFNPPDYNASLLLLPNPWKDIPNLPKTVVIAMPGRSVLAFGDGDDPKAVAALRAIAAMKDDYPVSRLLFRLAPGGLQPFR